MIAGVVSGLLIAKAGRDAFVLFDEKPDLPWKIPEQRHENEQYYKADGTPLTKEEEIEWLDMQYEQEVEWQKSCARIAAQGQAI